MADTIRKGGASNHGDLTGLGDDDGPSSTIIRKDLVVA